MSHKTPQNKREPYTLGIRDVLVIIMALIPIAVTWGVWSTKLTTQHDAIRDNSVADKQFRIESRSENAEIRKALNDLLVEINENEAKSETEINNIKERIKDIVKRLERHEDIVHGGKK